jgi:hypothetical protein
LVFSLVGLVLCLAFSAATLALLLPARLASITRYAPASLTRAVLHVSADHAAASVQIVQLSALGLSILGAAAGAVLLWWGRRRGAVSRDSVRALYLGGAGLVTYVIGSVTFLVSVVGILRYDVPGPAAIAVGLGILAGALYGLLRLYWREMAGVRGVAHS